MTILLRKRKEHGRNKNQGRLRFYFIFPLSYPPVLLLLLLLHPSLPPYPRHHFLHFPFDLHKTRRACSLLLSPGAREGWSTAQVMTALSSLRLTSSVSSLLTLYVGLFGMGSTTSGRPEARRDEKRRRGFETVNREETSAS